MGPTHMWDCYEMSAFDERPDFKKRVITVSVTAEQADEFKRLKAAIEDEQSRSLSDGAIIKRALKELSVKVLGE